MGVYDVYREVDFGDERLNSRLPRFLEQIDANPGASISAACGDPYQAKAAYRLLANEKVSKEAITEITQDVTIKNIVAAKPSVLLIPEDTCEFNYTNLKATEGLGSMGGSKSLKGLFIHSAIGVSEQGEVFGLLAQKAYIRPPEDFGIAKNRANIPIEEKESYKWLEVMADVQAALPRDIYAVHVCDRDGDMFELFCKAEDVRANYLCRKQYNRTVEDEDERKKLNEHMSGISIAGTIKVQVPRDSHTGRKAREAELEIKFGKCRLPKPQNLKGNKELPDSIEVYFVSAVEANPPEGEKGISWQLWTNVPTLNFDEAVTRIRWYVQRWLIEIFHRTLKSGCKVDERQHDTAEKLMKVISIYSIIALQIMLLTYVARTRPDASCEILMTEEEWKILCQVANKTKNAPEKAPTIKEAVLMIAKLGGFLGRKSDGEPGVTVVWRGLTKLYTILDAVPFLIM